jgi:hypothetical protein
MIQVYKITFSQNSYELNNEYLKLSEHEKETIANILPDAYFEFNNDSENYILYLIITTPNIDRYFKILNNNSIQFKSENISQTLLNGLDIDLELKEYINTLNNYRFNLFKKKIENWIVSNLEIDIILDRINQVGIDNLNNIEKKFLDNYNI